MHDYEPDREDGLCSINKMLEEATGIGEFLGEMRDRTFKPHDAFSVGQAAFYEKHEGTVCWCQADPPIPNLRNRSAS